MRIDREFLESRARLIHPKMKLFKSDPRCGCLYAFGFETEDGRTTCITPFMTNKELECWFDAFYNRKSYERAIETAVRWLGEAD